MEVSQAIAVGLILNEAITNAIKYAFDQSGGTIFVFLRHLAAERVTLTISDNGRGIPEPFDIASAPSMGMKMMVALSNQLRANLTFTHSDGVAISLEFGAVTELPRLKAKSE